MIIVPSLVLYLPFEGNAQDGSGKGNNGTISGGVSSVAGKFGDALKFDGINGSIDCGNGASLNFGTDSFSYGLWLNISNYLTPYDIPLAKGGGSAGNTGYDMEVNGSDWGAFIADGSIQRGFYIPAGVLNTWTHFFIVVNKSLNTMFGYKNGLLENTKDITGFGSVSSGSSLSVSNASYPITGSLDEVCIFNRALAESDVRRVMVNMAPLGG